jgi:hypothetical protein
MHFLEDDELINAGEDKHMTRKSSKGHEAGKKKLSVILGLVVLVIMILGVLVPLFLALTGSSKYEVNAEGVYILSNDKWVKLDYGYSPWLPMDNSSYIVYFRNLNCPQCREFDLHWTEFLRKHSRDVNATFVMVVCTYFQLSCSDPTAISTFNAFQVTASPLLVVISNMTLLYYGVPPFNSTELYNFTYNLLKHVSSPETSSSGETS